MLWAGSRVARGEPQQGRRFISIFNNSRNTWQLTRWSVYNHFPCPMPWALIIAYAQSPQVLQNRGSWMFMLRFKTLAERYCHWRVLRITEKENIIESATIYLNLVASAFVSPLTGSLPHKMAKQLQRVSAPF